MKKKIIMILILIVLIIIGIILIFINIKKEKYYDVLKDNLQEDIARYVSITSPYCSIGSPSFVLDNDILIVQAGIDKNKFLDINHTSYCDVKVLVWCIDENEHNWKIYLKCNNYVDDGFNNIQKEDYKNIINDNLDKIKEVSNLLSSNPYDYINNEYYNNIVNMNSAIVNTIVDMYNNNELKGLDAYILALAIQNITKCNLSEKYNITWSTPEDFYKYWKTNNCNFYK